MSLDSDERPELCADSHVPTYRPFPKRMYSTLRPERASPGIVTWFNGAESSLPLTTDIRGGEHVVRAVKTLDPDPY